MNSSRASITAVVLITSVLSVSGRQRPTPPPLPLPATPVSLIRVIANPEKFSGKRIGVIGFLGYADFDRALCLYVTDTEGIHEAYFNCIRLEGLAIPSTDKRIHKYVMLNARVQYDGGRESYNNVTFKEVSQPLLLGSEPPR